MMELSIEGMNGKKYAVMPKKQYIYLLLSCFLSTVNSKNDDYCRKRAVLYN
jgi:hypothetical protein